MSQSTSSPAGAEPVAQAHPHVRAVMRHLGLSLLWANIIPGALFYASFRIGNVFSMIVFDLDYENVEYGFRMDGPFNPHDGQWFDKSKILIRAMNKLHRLLRKRKSITFTDKSDQQILNQVVSDAGLSLDWKREILRSIVEQVD